MGVNPMQHRNRRLATATAALTLVAVGAGAGFAVNSQAASKSGGRGGIRSAITSYLGVTTHQLRADLRNGQTLAQIAATQGKSSSGLEQAIEAAVNSRLAQAVAAGKLTSQREQMILSGLQARLDKLVNNTHPGLLHQRGLLRRRAATVSAAYLGITPQALRSQLDAGKTLALVATDQGKTVSGLEQAIEAAIKTRLDKAVAAGRLTSQREQLILARLPARLDKLVNRT
jgi:hypothetical protein